MIHKRSITQPFSVPRFGAKVGSGFYSSLFGPVASLIGHSMRKEKTFLYICCVFLIGILFSSCERDDLAQLEEENNGTDQKLYSQDEAIAIAKDFLSQEDEIMTNFSDADLTLHEVKGTHNKAAAYIINNSHGGWQIIAASRVEEPLLAYSNSGSFDIEVEGMNEGLKLWWTKMISDMVLAYNDPLQYSQQFTPTSNSNARKPITPPDEYPCTDSRTVIGPIMRNHAGGELSFGQGFPENMHAKRCSNYNSSTHFRGRGAIGCVPVAMAQVMWHHRHPSNYNWGLIPRAPFWVNGSSASEVETGRLLWDIAEALEPYYYDLNACSSGTAALTSTSNNLDNAYDDFGYNATAFTSYYSIKNEIQFGRPVIAVGGNVTEQNRHCWVIEGYEENISCWDGMPGYSLYTKVYCNWGWSGNHNGWYTQNFVSPNGDHGHNVKFFKITEK